MNKVSKITPEERAQIKAALLEEASILGRRPIKGPSRNNIAILSE
jgi:hypothetical protein